MSTSMIACTLFALNIAAFSGPVLASERSAEDFVKACTASSNLSPAVCECSAKLAKAELTPGGYSLIVAMLEGNDAAAAQLRSTLPVEQVMKAGTFMTRGPAQCAKESPAAD